ncbi:MAG: hypothetical protein Q8876_09225 [Bacillota bacterium]|nr:hypothetical protein [Bacillota bacterium]
MEYSDNDMKKYDPQKGSLSRKQNQATNGLKSGATTSSDMPNNKKDIRRRQENFLFKGYGNMMDTSEMIDFSEGRDSDSL